MLINKRLSQYYKKDTFFSWTILVFSYSFRRSIPVYSTNAYTRALICTRSIDLYFSKRDFACLISSLAFMFFLYQTASTAANCNQTTDTVLPNGITHVLMDFINCKPNISNTFCRSQYDAYDIKDEHPSTFRIKLWWCTPMASSKTQIWFARSVEVRTSKRLQRTESCHPACTPLVSQD